MNHADPPEIEIERSWIHAGVHQETFLTCIVHAEPQANVRSSSPLLVAVKASKLNYFFELGILVPRGARHRSIRHPHLGEDQQ